MTVSTHVLDTGAGTPAAGVPVRLDHYDADSWRLVQEGETDENGRWELASPPDSEPVPEIVPGTYRLRFGSGRYFAARDVRSYYPEITVIFLVTAAGERHHVPLALGPYGYTTYRGS
ncbi:hydroxyisourate hydrolase [Actinomadura gamaensis]|uniref:5-hydroxyisourate hydrolase n=1 Tax=Actinomadura gamaensis TaxID=1763541 RepID=A0ABV9TT73_9ACTN